MRRLRLDYFLVMPILMALHGIAAAGIDEDWKKPTGPSFWSLDSVARLIGWKDAFGKSIAVVVGVGNYDHFARLSAPASDALRVRDFLKDEAGFDRIITITDENATFARLMTLMDRTIPGLVGPKDRFLFYFSGHGATRPLSRGDRGYLVLKSSQVGAWDDMINMDWVKSQWGGNVAQARHSLFLLDACFSGLAAFEAKGDAGEKTVERLMEPGHHIVTAGTKGEKSFIYNEQSLFTQAFLAAARGEGMAPGDGVVSLTEMMARVNRTIDRRRAELRDQIKMTPRKFDLWTDNSGEFFFVPRAGVAATTTVTPQVGAVVPKGPDADASGRAAETPRNDVREARTPGAAVDVNVPSNPQSSATTAYNMFFGAEANGRFAGSSYTNTLGDCQQRCSGTPGCLTFTFGRASRSCYLYSTASLVMNAAYDSGTRDLSLKAPINYNIFLKAEATGTFLESFPFTEIGDCQQRCSRASACTTFSFSRTSRTCYLYSTASLVANDAYDSGTRNLSLEGPGGSAASAGPGVPSAPSSVIEILPRTSASGIHARDAAFVSKLDDCQGLCLRSNNCKVFAFSRNTGACYFYQRAELEKHDSYEVGIRDPTGITKGR